MALGSLASFRKGATGIVTAGFLAASALSTFGAAQAQTLKTAAAEQSEPVTPTTDCSVRSTAKEILGDTKCEIMKGKVLDAQLACLRKIKIFFDAGKVSRERIMEYGKDRACELAKTLG